jgi:hypothetical protein
MKLGMYFEIRGKSYRKEQAKEIYCNICMSTTLLKKLIVSSNNKKFIHFCCSKCNRVIYSQPIEP